MNCLELLLFVVGFSLNQITLQKLYEEPILLASIRFINQVVFWLVTAIGIKFVIGSTLLIKDYSNHDLSPVISRTGNDGFNARTERKT